jgi:predicted DNA-binding transcriptional regulator AlpA
MSATLEAPTERRLLRRRKAAERLGVCERTLDRESQRNPDFPKPIKIGPLVCFVESEIDAYVEKLIAAR